MPNPNKPYKIEKHVEMPQPMRRGMYPWKDMEVGDSFYVPFPDHKKRSNLSQVLLRSAKNFTEKTEPSNKKFSTRRDDTGIRVWRIK